MLDNSYYNFNVERAILYTIIYNPADPEIINILLKQPSELFYHPFHRAAFETAQELFKKDEPIDEEFLRIGLQSRKAWDEIAFLDVLSANSVANVDSYIEILENLHKKRAGFEISVEIKKRLAEEQEDPNRVLEWGMKKLEDVASKAGALLTRKKMQNVEASDAEFMTKDWLPIPKGSVTVVSAPGGSGKTWSMLQLAIRAVMENRSLKAFLWLTEDHEGIVRSRFDAVCEKVVFNVPADVKERIEVSSDAPIVMLERNRGNFTISSKFYALKRELNEFDLIVIDPLLAFFGGDENDNGQARLFMQPWIDWAKNTGKSIVFVHHSKKGNDFGPKSRGAGAFIDAVRVAYELDKVMIKRDGRMVPKPDSLHMRKFTLTKDNWGAFKYLESFEFERHITPSSSAREVEVVYETKTYDMPTIA